MSSDDTAPADAIPGNETRAAVFLELVDAREELTPNQLGERIGASRENVMYHLNGLVDSGLVVRDDGEYFPQPLFVDPEFESAVNESIGELAPKASDLVYVDEDVPEDRRNAAVLNCLEAVIGLWLFDSESR